MPFDVLSLANTVKTLAIVSAVIMTAYAGFRLATSPNVQQREDWKEIIAGVIFGLVLLYLVPFIAAQLTGGAYCR